MNLNLNLVRKLDKFISTVFQINLEELPAQFADDGKDLIAYSQVKKL